MDDGNRAGGSAPLMATIQDPGMMMNPFFGASIPMECNAGEPRGEGKSGTKQTCGCTAGYSMCIYIYVRSCKQS